MDAFIKRIRPSNLEQSILYFIVEWRHRLAKSGDILQFLRHEYLISTDQKRLKPIFDEAVRYLCTLEGLGTWLAWEPPRFLVNGTMVTEKWGVKGRDLRRFLQGLRIIWVDTDCSIDAEALLVDETFEKVSQMPSEVIDREDMIPSKRRR